MKSKIFNSDQIRAIQDGRMTQFMQPVKQRISWEANKEPNGDLTAFAVYDRKGAQYWLDGEDMPASLADGFCPFGKVGDVIYCRET